MTAIATQQPAKEQPIVRFDRTARYIHWTNAALFGVLVLTGASLYIAPLSTVVGRRELVKTIHVYAGLALPLPVLAGYLLRRRGRAFRADVARLNRWAPDDWRWLRSLGRDRSARLDKFNPGQKLNAAFTLGAIVVMLGTGSIMHWFRYFPVDWRTGATFVHDWLAIVLTVVILGHLKMAFSDADARRGMSQGWVPTIWARRHRPKWYEEMTGHAARPERGGPPTTNG